MTNSLISVLIPTYNRANMVVEAIQSVLIQSYQDFEIVVVDDGSTDDTKARIDEIGDQRIRYYYQENTGRPGARNHTLRLAQGQYLTFLDSDDLYLPEKLRVQVAFMEANPHIGMSYTQTERVMADGTPVDVLSSRHSGWVHRQLIRHCSIATPSVMLRREVVERVGDFDAIRMEDIDYWIRVAEHFEVAFIPQTLVQVRLKQGENLVRDPELVLKHQPYIVRKNSTAYSAYYRRRVLSKIYFSISRQFLEHKPERIGKAWQVFSLGLVYWPLKLKMPRLFIDLIVETLTRRRRLASRSSIEK